MVVEITANHRGHFEIELCPQTTETNNCFQRLNIVSGSHEIRSGNMMCVGPAQVIGPIFARVQLPANVRCTRCTLRWTYRTSYPPGDIKDTNRSDCNLCLNILLQHLTIVSIPTQLKRSETVLISELTKLRFSLVFVYHFCCLNELFNKQNESPINVSLLELS